MGAAFKKMRRLPLVVLTAALTVPLLVLTVVFILWLNGQFDLVTIRGTIRTPSSRDHVTGEVLLIYALDSPEDASFGRDLRAWYRKDEEAHMGLLQTRIASRGLRLEKRVKLDEDSFKCSVSPGMKLLVLGCKGYGWIELVEAEADTRLDLDRSNATWGYAGKIGRL